MKDLSVRICKIELKGFKSIKSGVIEMPSGVEGRYFSKKSDVLGIYGQNGSGKTAVIEAMELIRLLLSGNTLPADTQEYIHKEKDSCTLAVTFTVETQEIQSKVVYKVELKRSSQKVCVMAAETLTYSKWNGVKFEKQKVLLSVTWEDVPGHFTPEFRYQAFIRKNRDKRTDLGVAKRITEREGQSFFFGRDGLGVLLSGQEREEDGGEGGDKGKGGDGEKEGDERKGGDGGEGGDGEKRGDQGEREDGEKRGDQGENGVVDRARDSDWECMGVVRALQSYANSGLFVVFHSHLKDGGMKFNLPMSLVSEAGQWSFRLDGPVTISQEHDRILCHTLAGMNRVLTAMIPGLSLEIRELGRRLMENGDEGRKIQLVSRRGDVRVPLSFESEGIIKIISILNMLVCVYNNPSMCLIMDELDAGIYEYLLGELLAVFEKGAKGQLIFTSHNLRPLEMLPTTSILFSTSNAQERYIRIKRPKTSQNLRTLYLRAITLGGQKEEIYEETDIVEIGRAFRQAGKEADHDSRY